ncbi:retropepsin-like aspartic protease [Rhizosphaericola mali]|uniref:Uncharacterized protein n=1 Tax=Rhizosphaericola mali TaxID=2545455 RepID=A0A5P2G0U1_9BACT|nr:retropepsin-like aspartic protease [Rhizosphaericola mali]QES89426.1 hypothetical protein E0W69_012380 [Rhizosphaericola mali]
MTKLSRSFYCIIVLFILCSSVTAQSTILNFTIGSTTGTPVVSVNVNGKLLNFILDTGSPFTVINKGVIENTPIDSSVQLDAVGNKFTVYRKKVKDFQLGTLRLNNLDIQEFDLTTFFPIYMRCLKIDGIIGCDILHNYIVSLNPEKKEVKLMNPKEVKLENIVDSKSIVVDFKMPKSYYTPMVLFTIFKKQTLLTFDTGGANYIGIGFSRFKNDILASNYILSHGSPFYTIKSTVQDNDNYFVEKIDFNLSKNAFSNQNIIFSSKEINNLGYGFIKNFETIIDWKSKKIYLKKLGNMPILNNSLIRKFGFNYSINNKGRIYIAEITNNNNKLHIGDEVIGVNEKKIVDVCNFELNDSLLDNKKNTLFILRDGIESEIML